MGEGDLQDNGRKGDIRPGQLRFSDDNNQGNNPPSDSLTPALPEVQSLYGRSGSQNSQGQVKPPMRFMDGEEDKRIPNTHGKEWDEVDETGRIRKVHRRPHWQLPAPMSQDKSPTMEDNAAAAERRQRTGSPKGPTPDDIAQKKANDRQEARRQEIRIREFTDWAPNVVGNDWMGGAGAALAVLAFARGPNTIGTIARMAKGFGAGSIATAGMQWGLNDGIDKIFLGKDHGAEFNWFTEGVVGPACLWRAASSKPIERVILGSEKLLSRPAAIGIGLPLALSAGASLLGLGLDKGLKTADRNPTYSDWFQQKGIDSAITGFAGAAAFALSGRKWLPTVATMAATWGAARVWNHANPQPTPANEFDRSIGALDKLQKERTTESMDDAIAHLREFGNFGRTDILKNPLDLQHPEEILGNLHDQFVGRTKLRVNGEPTSPELYKFADIFEQSEHNRGGYAGLIGHAVVNFEAGQRALKWGAVGVEKMPLGNAVGQDTKVDIGGEALRKFITARREVDLAIKYATEHDGQIPEGDSGVQPINKEVEVKMLTELRNRIQHSIDEVVGPHDKLDQVINEVKDRLWSGHWDSVNELRADTKERAKYPKLQDPELTPMLQAKLCRDAAMIDLAMAELRIDSKARYNNASASENSKQLSFITSQMPDLQVTFGEALAFLSWSRTKMSENDPAQADLLHIANRAYALYEKAKKAGLPEMQVMSEYLEDFRAGKLKQVVMDYTNDAVNRAAIRNGRNPIKDELEQYENPPQQTPADRQRDQAAEEQRTQQTQTENQEAGQLQDQNATMQQAEIDLANRRQAYSRAHIQEEVGKFRAKMGRPPTGAELEAIDDSLMQVFDYLHQSGQLKEEAPQSDSSSQAPQPQTQPQQTFNAAPLQQQAPSQAEVAPQQQQQAPYQAAAPQQQMPRQYQANQPAMVDPKVLLQQRVGQFMMANGRSPNAAELREIAKELSSTQFRMSDAQPNNTANTYQPLAPQQPVPVIHQGTPDQ